MSLFDAVKAVVTIKDAAQMYGFKIGKNQMAICPFHKDKTPSMKVDKRFHCFGCGADGDVIDFVSRYFGIGSLDAAKKLVADFGIRYDERQTIAQPKKEVKRKSESKIYAELEKKCFRVLAEYYHLLEKWEADFKPQIDDDDWHPLFVEALQNKKYLEYLLDIWVFGDIEERAILVMRYGKKVKSLEERISKLASKNAGGSDAEYSRITAMQECRRGKGTVGTDREWQRQEQH